MNNVVFLSSDNINAQTGAAKFARLLISKPEMWKKQGFNLISITNSSTFSDEQTYRKTFRYKAKQIIKTFLGKTKIGRRIRFFNYQMKQLGAKPVSQLYPYINNQAYFILNDFRVAWNFYKKYDDKHKTIFIMHNSGDMLSMLKDEMREKHVRHFLLDCERKILKCASQIVFVSEVARNNFISVHPEYKDKTRTIYIGMDKSGKRTLKDTDIVRFVTVGTVCEGKNQILAIKAVEKLRKENIELTVVGGGPFLAKCQDYVKLKGLEESIHFTGATNKVEEILTKNNIFIMTSTDEGLPVAAQEAMAVGMPLIVTDVGGCRELIEDNGVIIQPKIEDVVDAIQFFIENRDKIVEYGNKSYELYQRRFSLIKMQESYIKAVLELK